MLNSVVRMSNKEISLASSSNNLPSVEEVARQVEKALKDLFQENYKTGVIKYKAGLYLVLPPEFFHFPPAILSCEPHPDDPDRALYVVISLRIPVPCDDLISAISNLKNVQIFEIEKIDVGGEEADKSLCFINVGVRIHCTSVMNDYQWFLMMLSSVLRSPLQIYPNIRERQDSQFPSVESLDVKESEAEGIW